jgi:hypothetical protein
VSDGLTPQAFRERFALATFSDGGVVADLTNGSYGRVNATGAAMLAALDGAASFDDAAADVAARLKIPVAVALRDLRGLVATLGGAGVRTAPIGVLRYRPAPEGGYDLWHGERRALHVDASTSRLTLASPPESLPFKIYDYVSDIAPKLLFLLGIPILHGSSVALGEGVLAMCGMSRAGKTTTARAFAAHGSRLVSEDLVVLDTSDGEPRVFLEAEARVRQWFRQGSRELEASPAAALDVQPLRDAAAGPTRPLDTLWFLDASRRGDGFVRNVVGKTDALVELLTHAFLGAEGETSWRRYLAAGRAVVSAATPCRMHLPNGLAALDEAIRLYRTSSAS